MFIFSILIPSNRTRVFFFYRTTTRRFTAAADSTQPEFPAGETAYEILGVAETSSFAEIKSSFRKLAKQTHPDLADPETASSSSHRFIQILAAYEILSDSEKRLHYDWYLLTQRKVVVQKHSREGSTLYTHHHHQFQMASGKQMEVVEWLKWYRMAVNDILAERKVATGTGYFDELEDDFYSAIRTAFYGPLIESMELLPDRFEAEERSVYETPEVLHLVSGRDIFGMVCLVDNKTPELSSSCHGKLASLASASLDICPSIKNDSMFIKSNVGDTVGSSQIHAASAVVNLTLDTYKDLELRLGGRVVAVSSRIPPKSPHGGVRDEDFQDEIHVFLNSEGNDIQHSKVFSKDSFAVGAGRARIPLGSIMGLGSSSEEGSCFVYDSTGAKTHVIMKHRTLMVKHLHWYDVGDETSVCECRCSRARLPPSKFWLFEPRCSTHDIGGWYVETFGKDKKGRTVPSQRYWDGFDGSEQYDKRLHPAMYLLALAYRTLDLEDARRRKQTVRTFVEGQLFKIMQWCKKIV